MGSKETPISKYLANLEKRKSLFLHQGTSPSPLQTTRNFHPPSSRLSSNGLQMKINFDDTFFSQDPSESILHISPPSTSSSSVKRKRTSGYFDQFSNETETILQKKIGDLEKCLREAQCELIDARTKSTKLDQVNIDLKRTLNEKIIELEKSNEELKLKTKTTNERADALEKQLVKIRRRDSGNSKENQNQLTKQLERIGELENSVAKLEKLNNELMQKLTEESIQHEDELQAMQTKVQDFEKTDLKHKQDVELYQIQLADQQNLLKKCQEELKSAQLEVAKQKEFQKKYESVDEQDESIVNNEKLRKFEDLYIREQLANQEANKNINKLKEQNKMLTITVQREHLLQEQLLSMESDNAVLKSQLQDKEHLENERARLAAEVKSWIAVATKLDTNCRTPLSFDTLFRKNQDLLLQTKLENSNLRISNESNTRLLKSVKDELSITRELLESVTSEKQKLGIDLRKTNWRLNMITQDRNGLRLLKESYEQEYEGQISEAMQIRITQLEATVDEYEKALSEDPSLRRACQECTNKLNTIKALNLELQTLKDEKERFSQILDSTYRNVPSEETTGVKIISFGKNPSMLSIEARLKECINENEALRAKLKQMEEDTLASGSIDTELAKGKAEVEERFRALERKHELLTEAYDFETTQLQNVCTKLLGYHVVFNRPDDQSPNLYRLTSVYSNAPDETFVIQEGQQGETLLLETPILAHFQDDIERFCRQEGSIPAFLSSVTITYAQGLRHQETLTSGIFDDTNNDTVHFNPRDQESLQILATETISSLPLTSRILGREAQIEVDTGTDPEDNDEDEYVDYGTEEERDEEGGGDDEDDIYGDLDNDENEHEHDSEGDGNGSGPDDDIVMID